MRIHILRQRATEKEVSEMLEELKSYIKLAVDVFFKCPTGYWTSQGFLITRKRRPDTGTLTREVLKQLGTK